MKHVLGALIGLAAVIAVPTTAEAFCGFYVSPGDAPLLADATQVVLMRKGTRTVLSMQNNYKGPPSAFAMVIPVPVVLKEADVKTLPDDVFGRVERMGAPRLVEYWEQDPCYVEPEYEMMESSSAPQMKSSRARSDADDEDLGVTIEAKFSVGEYQIVVLGAKDSTGLDTWLRREKYNIPKGAEPLLRPYVESGMKFFVAKVDIKKVSFVDGRAKLSPIRFHYDSDRFELPIRLGLANSSGTQDLIVNILAPAQRYEVANYKNVTIPTNLDVKQDVKTKFPAFYAALFDRTVEKNPGAVVTEYAWQATTCDPCPGPALDGNDFTLLGSDVLESEAQLASDTDADPDDWGPRKSRRRPNRQSYDFVLTRLHARYGKDLRDDLVFKAAGPIVGGREHVVDGATSKLEEGSRPDSINNFQGRYAIRYPWTGPVTCANPRRGIWGGPNGSSSPTTQPALELAFAPRGGVKLASSIVPQNVPELAIENGALLALPKVESPMGGPASGVPPVARGDRGCGCQSTSPVGVALLGLLGALGLLLRRRPRA
jgi:MYXO-CTERM domain-containing protein